MEILKKRLRQLREDNNMTQSDIGAIIGVQKGAISYYESGTNMPSFDDLTKIADHFDKSLDFFAGRDFQTIVDDREGYNNTKYIKKVSFCNEEVRFIKEIRKNSNLHSQLIDNPENLVARMKIKL